MGLKHPRVLVKAYTVFFILWAVVWLLVVIADFSANLSDLDSLSLFSASVIILLLFVLPPFTPLYYYYRRSLEVHPKPTAARREEFLKKMNFLMTGNN
ncbi:MAG: hypothetical protein QXU11_07145 [Thermoproteota archaeon]